MGWGARGSQAQARQINPPPRRHRPRSATVPLPILPLTSLIYVLLTLCRSALFSPTGTRKTVRFSESNTYQPPPSRPSEDYPPSDILSQQQQLMLDQDDSLDRLSESIGRQRELSIQIGDELDSQGELLEDLDVVVDRSRSRLDGARRRLDRFSRKAKDNGTLLSTLSLSCSLVVLLFPGRVPGYPGLVELRVFDGSCGGC